jgi:hypothetical protein
MWDASAFVDRFGLNCQAVSDSRGRLLDLSMMYPGSASDYLPFEGLALHERLKNG